MVNFRSNRQSTTTRRYEIGGVLFEQHPPTVQQAEMVRQEFFEVTKSTDGVVDIEGIFGLLGADRIQKICAILLTRSRPGEMPDRNVQPTVIGELTDKTAWEVIFRFFIQSPASAKMIGAAIGQKFRTITRDLTPAPASAR